MKTISKKMLSLVILLSSCGFTQPVNSQATDMDVNGVFIGGTYTKQQVEQKWGSPTKYRSSESESGLNEIYDYAGAQFHFNENGIFASFSISTANFVVYAKLNGGIKVGDPFSRILAIGLGTPVLQKDGTYYVRRGNEDDPIVFRHKNGVITLIMFTTSV